MLTQTELTVKPLIPDYGVSDADRWLGDTLLAIGILPNLSGYHHICRAVSLTAKAGHRNDAGTVYEMLAEEFDTAPANIERNIRNAISCAYKSGGLLYLNKIINVEVVKSNYQILSNTQFVSLLAHYYIQKSHKRYQTD